MPYKIQNCARLFIILLLIPSTVSANNLKTPDIVVSIKPIYALVAMITHDVTQPKLLLSNAVDPHHFNLRPSQRKLIANAELLVWIGPELEASLKKVVSTSNVNQLQLLQTNLPIQHTARNFSHKHVHNADHIDPHIWLSPDNAAHILTSITQSLSSIDNKHSETYQNNLSDALMQINILKNELKSDTVFNNKAYIAHHDSYQYFEKTFGLTLAGAITDSNTHSSGTTHLIKLNHLTESQLANCIIYETQQPPKITGNLIKPGITRMQRIDPFGSQFSVNAQLWLNIMRHTATAFKQCLQ